MRHKMCAASSANSAQNCNCGAFILLRIRSAVRPHKKKGHMTYALMCAVCVRVCVCMATATAATQRLNLFSTKLNHQKFANNNAGVIYLTHGVLPACLENARRSRSNNNNNRDYTTKKTYTNTHTYIIGADKKKSQAVFKACAYEQPASTTTTTWTVVMLATRATATACFWLHLRGGV